VNDVLEISQILVQKQSLSTTLDSDDISGGAIDFVEVGETLLLGNVIQGLLLLLGVKCLLQIYAPHVGVDIIRDRLILRKDAWVDLQFIRRYLKNGVFFSQQLCLAISRIGYVRTFIYKSHDYVVRQNEERNYRTDASWHRLEIPLLVVRQSNWICIPIKSVEEALGLLPRFHSLY
jgi:hypothetical protein